MSNPTADLSGVDIGKVMSATGPIVKAVLLRCQPENTEDDQKISAKDSAPSTNSTTTKKEGGDDDSDDDESISPEQAAEIRLSTKSLISQITIDTTPKERPRLVLVSLYELTIRILHLNLVCALM